ncbi:MAG TPA: hypothetical protein VF950_19975 [Planctomycetota bacterium]
MKPAPNPRFVARAEGGGWRIWDHKTKRWVGEPYAYRPEEVIAKLNGAPGRTSKLRKLP